MDVSTRQHIVKYENFCNYCKFKDNPEDSIPCNNCLNNPVVSESNRPIEYKPNEEGLQRDAKEKEELLLDSKSRLIREDV